MVLLDVNVLIALIDRRHSHHEIAWRWFTTRAIPHGWATCPITENGTIRIVSSRSYPNRAEVREAVDGLERVKAIGRHQFWADEISLTDPEHFRHDSFTSVQSTDVYLLALAVHKGGTLATFDRNIPSSAVLGGEAALHLIEA